MTPSERSTLEYTALGRNAAAHEPLPSLHARPLPHPGEVRIRELLGIPVAMTDYAQTMDVMDGLIAREERGWICAVAVHAVMVAQNDPEMRRALVGSTLTVPD